MHKASLLFIFEPCQGSKVRCLRSAPVRAGRGPPDLVRRLALMNKKPPQNDDGNNISKKPSGRRRLSCISFDP